MRNSLLEGVHLPCEENQQGRSRENHAALKTSARRELPVASYIDPEHYHGGHHELHGHTNCIRALNLILGQFRRTRILLLLLLLWLALFLSRLLTEKQQHADNGSKQDEFLSQRVNSE